MLQCSELSGLTVFKRYKLIGAASDAQELGRCEPKDYCKHSDVPGRGSYGLAMVK
ncbi:hypothetical protein BH11VER1_BH11VER1_06290 [soil metagenome]